MIAAAPRVLLPGRGLGRRRHAAAQRQRARGSSAAAEAAGAGHLPGDAAAVRAFRGRPAQCLGVLPQTVRKLTPAPGRPVPHMGWNPLHIVREDPLLEGVAEGEYAVLRAQLRRAVSPTARWRRADYGVPHCRGGAQGQLLGHAVSSRALRHGRRAHSAQFSGAASDACC